MKHPSHHARVTPDKIAYQMAGSGERLTFAELDAATNRAANAFRSLAVGTGDHIALMMENRLDLLVLAWAAQRSGLIFTLVSRYLTADEAAYIVADCGAKVFVTSHQYVDVSSEIRSRIETPPACMMVGGTTAGFESWERLAETMPATPVADESAGSAMLYSSGTTGHPKGIVRRFATGGIEYANPIVGPVFEDLAGFTGESVYLSPAPLYHSAPLSGAMVAAANGATTIVLERFTEETFLGAVQDHAITHTQV
ncbi:MAG: AMP-binding protein, partial [Pseudomonadota bacterium]